MNLLTAKTRITIGLAGLSVSVILVAIFFGMVPDRKGAILEGRRKLCEAVAVNGSIMISRKDMKRLGAILQIVVTRNEDILSAGLRREDGQLVVEIGDHATQWLSSDDERSTHSQVHVPLRAGDEKWGAVELRFEPLDQPGLLGFLYDPMTRLVTFCGSAGFLVYLLYLKKMLQHLDPSHAVPKRVRTALDSLAEGLLVVDNNGRIVLGNQAFASWVDYKPERLIGRDISALPWTTEEESDPEDYPWKRALTTGQAEVGVFIALLSGEDSRRNLMANATPIPGPDGVPRGVLISLDDITLLEETKKELLESKQIADHANRAKSEFLARMSHEIRTPMNAILGYTDVMRRGFDESIADRQEYLSTIHGSGEHLLALINDILDLSKIESGKMEVELKLTSPYELIKQTIAVLRGKAEEKGITLGYEFEGKLPETIMTDSVRLRQTIMNLVGNAIKFTKEGGVRIVTRLVKDAACPMLQIDVVDTGIGISQDAIDKVFDPFAQADNSITRRFGGTGLGLAISRQLVEALGGTVSVTSELGVGSTFSISVETGSLDGVQMLDEAEAKVSIESNSVERKEDIQLAACRVLVVDDGDSNRKLMQLFLRRAGAVVQTAENGLIAYELAMAMPYDAILMDMQMPVMDGYTAAAKLREEGYAGPIIALTAHAMQGDEERCKEAGCSGYLTKPIDLDLLLTKLAEIVGEDTTQTVKVVEGGSQIQSDLQQLLDLKDEVLSPSEPRLTETNQNCDPHEDLASTEQRVAEPIFSDLPMDDEEFREIVVEFTERLSSKLNEMRDGLQNGDLDEVASLAHWLKGSGGTAGFGEFTLPAIQLEQAAKNGQQQEAEQALVQIEGLTCRISVPDLSTNTDLSIPVLGSNPDDPVIEFVEVESAQVIIKSTLPTDDYEFAEIVVEFAQRLEEKLDAMELANNQADLDEVAKLAHWLKGSGGTAGFDAFTIPARELEKLAKAGANDRTQQAIEKLRELARCIELPNLETSVS